MTLPISPKNHLKRTYSDTIIETPLQDAVMVSAPLEAPVISTSDSGIPLPSIPSQTTDPVTVPNPVSPIIQAATTASKTTNSPHALGATISTSTNPMKKRTKLSESEKEAKRQEKEAKEEEKAKQKAKKEEEKIRKDEEKAKKDEERRVKDAEKEKKRREKEEQTRLKEDEKRKLEEKKQKSQMRLNAFFPIPNLPNDGSTASLPQGTPSPVNSRRSSIVSLQGADTPARERSASAIPGEPEASEYARRFPSFFLQSYTTLAPLSRFERDEEGLQYTQKQIDERISDTSATHDNGPFNPIEMLHLPPYKRRKLDEPQLCVKEIMEQLHGTSQNPIDLTGSRGWKTAQEPLDLLKIIPTKFLKFIEDVRPPYAGTYTRVRDPAIARQICRNPFTRGLPTTDYDYDSEAEWEEPGEGEDLDSEGEEEIESEDGDDMEGFLDDEDAADSAKTLQKRRLVTGNLEPISTGLCWEDDSNYQALRDLAQYQLEVMLGKSL
ncbi:MAG: hypothetical protein Q9192_002124 [Flavoplaca navasiana]